MAPSSSPSAEHELPAEELHHQHMSGLETTEYFASVFGGIILCFALIHWTRRLCHKLRIHNTRFGWGLLTTTRPVTKFLYGQRLRGSTHLPERYGLAVAYLATNTALCVWRIDWHRYTTFANRLGWLSLCNMCLVVLLALKNTPLSPLCGRSYESLNTLHRYSGWTTIIMMTVHSAIYAAGLFRFDASHLLTTPGTIGADVAGIAMLLILTTANGYVRKRHYELFFITHVFLVAITLVTVGFHTSKAAMEALIMALVVASVWLLDRSLRFSRWLYYLPGNYCTLTPLAHGATRVTLRRSIRAAPGSHAFLYIPGIRKFQTHPFTMISREPVEFVVSARDGFTRALYEAACKKPGIALRAGIEGPYGNVPDVLDYERVVLLAGGSGATFTFALAVEWTRKRALDDRRRMEFVWCVKTAAQLQGFRGELAELQACPSINVRIQVTQTPSTAPSPGSETPTSPKEGIAIEELSKEMRELESASADQKERSYETPETVEVEALPACATYGRPNVPDIVGQTVAGALREERILVAVCGPDGLSDNARAAVALHTKSDAPSIELHTEAFGF